MIEWCFYAVGVVAGVIISKNDKWDITRVTAAVVLYMVARLIQKHYGG